jgi:hypothetical protein
MIRIVELRPEDTNPPEPWPPTERGGVAPVAATELVGALAACCAHAAPADRNNAMNTLNVSFMCDSPFEARFRTFACGNRSQSSCASRLTRRFSYR